jgi:hypothetical protein
MGLSVIVIWTTIPHSVQNMNLRMLILRRILTPTMEVSIDVPP